MEGDYNKYLKSLGSLFMNNNFCVVKISTWKYMYVKITPQRVPILARTPTNKCFNETVVVYNVW